MNSWSPLIRRNIRWNEICSRCLISTITEVDSQLIYNFVQTFSLKAWKTALSKSQQARGWLRPPDFIIISNITVMRTYLGRRTNWICPKNCHMLIWLWLQTTGILSVKFRSPKPDKTLFVRPICKCHSTQKKTEQISIDITNRYL